MNIEQQLGEKHDAIANRIEQVATALAAHYDFNIPRDDLRQEMWMALIQRMANPTFLDQPVKDIVNKLAWRAKDYARKQFRHLNRLPLGPRSQSDERDAPWEFIAMPFNAYDAKDNELDAIDLVDRLMEALSDRPKTLRIARSILEGRNKLETARHLDLAPSTVSGHIATMRQMVAEMMAC